jgi:hypothetical protein
VCEWTMREVTRLQLMSTKWYYTRNGESHGPISSAELRSLAAAGGLDSTDLLWKHGMDGWKPAAVFPRLFPAAEGAVRATPAGESEEPDPLAAIKIDVTAASRRSTSKAGFRARAAGRVALLAAEQAKITAITLPLAYAALGESCYRTRTHAEAFPDLFAEIDSTQAPRAGQGRSTGPSGDTFAAKATAWARQGVTMAHSQVQEIQVKALFIQLGKACFNQFGLRAGAEEVVARVQSLRDRLATINAEVPVVQKQTSETKIWLMYSGGALLCLVLIGSCLGGNSNRTHQRSTDSTNPAASYSRPQKRTLASIEKESYGEGYQRGVELGRPVAQTMRWAIKNNMVSKDSTRSEIQRMAWDFKKSAEGSKSYVEDIEAAYGSPQKNFERFESPIANRGLCRGMYDGYMSQVREYMR